MGPLGWGALGWAVGVAATSLWAILPRRRPRAARPLSLGPLLVVRPCAGGEPGLERALLSTRTACAEGRPGVRFAVARRDDAACAIAESVCTRLQADGIDALVVVTAAEGPNRKIDQLSRVLANEPAAAILVVADSDLELEAGALESLLSALNVPGVAASWLAPVERGGCFADRCSAAVLDSSLHAFPLLARLDPGAYVGKLMAVRADELRAIGGLATLRFHLGEDLELARRLRAAGFRIVRAQGAARSLAGGRRWSQVVARYSRWLSVIRAQRPWLLLSYPLLLAATPLIVAVSAGAALREGPAALSAAALALAARLAVAGAARRESRRPWTLAGLWLDAALADLLLLAAFSRALSSRRLEWRGVRLRLGRGGQLERDDS